MLVDDVGAGPLAIARAQRAQTARLLIETTAMSFTDVAFAAGFGSVRQFNDTVRAVYASSPSELRTSAARRPVSPGAPPPASPSTTVSLRLATRTPFAGQDVLAFIAQRSIPGIEDGDGVTYRRTLRLPGGDGRAALVVHDDHVRAAIALSDWADLPAAVQRLRRLLDLDADPVAVDDALGADPVLAPLVARTPGRRAPGSVDAFETAVRAVIGQQVSVAGARTVAAKLVAATSEPSSSDERVPFAFPTPSAVADAADDAFAMPGARRDTIRRLAAAVAAGTLELHAGVDPAEARRRLLELKGIGPWTADYIVMRGLGHPDVHLDGDLGVRHAVTRLGLDPRNAATRHRWAPWRSYAVHHLWASLDAPNRPATDRSDRP